MRLRISENYSLFEGPPKHSDSIFLWTTLRTMGPLNVLLHVDQLYKLGAVVIVKVEYLMIDIVLIFVL